MTEESQSTNVRTPTKEKLKGTEKSTRKNHYNMSGARAVIKAIEEQGTRKVFGVIGGAIMPVYDELGKSKTLRHVAAAHEQGAIHAADAYARVSGEPGVVFATSGPGAANLMTGIANAYMDSSPVIAITGQVPTSLIGQDSFQEVDVRGMSDPITKHNYLVMNSEDIPKVLRESYSLAKSGRPGPIVVDLPKDVQTGSLTWTDGDSKKDDVEVYENRPDFDEKKVSQIANALIQSEKPLVLIGGGIAHSKAERELIKVVEQLELPVASSLMGLGCIKADDPHFLGMVGMHGTGAANKAISNADLLLAIGTRLDDRLTGNVGKFAPKAKVAHVDIDPAEMGKIIQPDIPITGDAKEVLSRLQEITEGETVDRTEWWRKIRTWSERYSRQRKTKEDDLKPQTVVKTLDELTGDDTIVTTGVGQHQMWVAQYYGFSGPNQLVTSGGLGTMGFGLPAAIGAQLAAPDRPVVTVTGDGSFQMNIQELATAVREKLPITVVILRNGSLGMVRQWQQLFFEKRFVETLIDEGTPPLAKVAGAYGAKGITVAKESDLRASLKAALEYNKGPSVVECIVPPEENVFPMVPSGEGNENFILEEKDV